MTYTLAIPKTFKPPEPKGVWTWRTLKKDFLRIRKPGGKGVPKRGMSFGELHPHLAREFYSIWNGDTAPTDFRSGSKCVVFWKCPSGHIYPSAISNRVLGSGCPFCIKERPTNKRNLQTLYPIIASQWHPTLNGIWTPEDFLPGSDAKAVWVCSDNPEHLWVSTIKHRTYMKSGCPHCRGSTSKAEMRLMAELQAIFGEERVRNRIRLHRTEVDLLIELENHPPLCVEFDGGFYHRTRKANDDAKVRKLEKAGFKVIRIRGEGLECTREFDISVSYNEERSASPQLAFTMANSLAKLLPKESPYYSRVTDYARHRRTLNEKGFQTLIKTMHRPKEGESLLDKRPDIIHIWSTKNIRHPKDIASGCNDYFELKCNVCGHEWPASANILKRGHGCRICYNRRTSDRLSKCAYEDSILAHHKELIETQWDYKRNRNIDPAQTALASNQIAWWKCVNCRRSFRSIIQNRVKRYLKNNQSGCAKCYGFGVVYVFKNVKTGQQIEATNAEMVQRLKLSAGNVSLLCSGKRANTKGWVCLGKKGQELKDHSLIDVNIYNEKYHFKNLDTGEEFSGTQGEMWRRCGLIQSSVSAICTGKIRSTNNWVCLGLVGGENRDINQIRRSTKGDLNIFKNLLTGQQVTSTITDMAKRYTLFSSALSHLKSGKFKKYKNWVYLGRG